MPNNRIKTAGVLVAGLFLLLTANISRGETSFTIEERILTLSQCIDIALRLNPSGELALQNLKAVQEKTEESRAGYYPSLKLSSTYTYTTPQENMPQILVDSYDTRLAVRQTLFDGGATANLLKGIGHSINAQEHEVRKTELDIIHAIRTTFIDILKKRALLTVKKTALAGNERHLTQAMALYREGVSPRSDVSKSEVQVSNSRLEVVAAENAVLSAKATLSAFMGVPVTVLFDVDGRAVDSAEPEGLPAVNEFQAEARGLRPEIKGFKARLGAADAAIGQSESGLYPNVSLDASYGWQENSFVPMDKKWGVGLTVGIPVFEQFTARSKVNQAKANRNGLKAVEMQTLRAIELEVEQAWLFLKEARERLQVSSKALEQATEDMRISEGRYKEGFGNILEVIDARTALTSAGTNSVIAAYDIASARATLDRATGKGKTEEYQ